MAKRLGASIGFRSTRTSEGCMDHIRKAGRGKSQSGKFRLNAVNFNLMSGVAVAIKFQLVVFVSELRRWRHRRRPSTTTLPTSANWFRASRAKGATTSTRCAPSPATTCNKSLEKWSSNERLLRLREQNWNWNELKAMKILCCGDSSWNFCLFKFVNLVEILMQ